MRWSWLFPIVTLLGCGSSEESEDMSIDSPPARSLKKAQKKVAQPTYNAIAGRSVAIDSNILLPKTPIHSRTDSFALLSGENNIYQEIKVDELYQKTEGFYDLVKIPEVEALKEEKRKVLTVPFNRLVGTVIGKGMTALVEMTSKKVIEVKPGDVVEGWRLKYLASDKLDFEYLGEGIPKEITLTSKAVHNKDSGKEKEEVYNQQEIVQEEEIINENE